MTEAVATRVEANGASGAAARRDLSRVQFVVLLLVIVSAALALRVLYPAADPPNTPGVGIVWHDEGAWVHNARNRALFGAWTLDEWNPMYVTPVLTGLEYVAFAVFGVGLRQARLVPELLGVLSALLLGLGVGRVTNRLGGVIAAALLATNFVYVMYDRAATIEATMVAFLVIAWYAYARAQQSPRWGALAGLAAIVAYFTKASAVFFVAALGIDALLSLLVATRATPAASRRDPDERRAASWTLVGLAGGAAIALAAFVLPNWHAYRFYNWQTSVTRKPSYTARALLDRASQLPLVADLFTRMWLVVGVGVAAGLARLVSWRKAPPAERLLLWWIGLGTAELIAHDIQDRRLLFLIPPLAALAAIAFARRRLAPAELCAVSRRRALLALPVVFYCLYAIAAAIARVPFLYRVDPGEHPGPAVRTSLLLAVLLTAALYGAWRRASAWLAGQRWTLAASLVVVALVVTGDIAQFAQWAASRSYKNYDAMLLIAKWLPPGTAVQGKLANGLALESRIRPIFVGRGFGNYADRSTRDDVRYVATYSVPFVGYEGGRDAASGRSIIWDVLDAYPNRTVLHVFDVCESAGGHDTAMLIDKRPASRAPGERGHDGR